jgi:hypothetical protein
MNPRDVVRLAHDLRGQPLAAVDAELHRRHLDAETRLQVKLELQAAGAPTVKAAFELATDTAVGHQERTTRPKTTMERLLDRVGIDDQRQYTEPELNELLAQAGLDLEQRLAVKIECESLRLIRHTSVTDRLLQQLGIDGPIDQLALEARLDRHGIDSVAMRTAVRAECQRRGWLKGGGNGTIRASTVLKGRDGKPLTLRSRP